MIETWILTDTEKGHWANSLDVKRDELSVNKKILHGGLCDGVDLIEVGCGDLHYKIVPTRGMGLWKAEFHSIPFGWQSPVSGPVHPRFVPLDSADGLGWLSGFDELMVRCGLISNGAPDFDENHRLTHPLHGRIANIPARYVSACVDTDTGRVEIKGIVDEARFHSSRFRLTTTYQSTIERHTLEVIDSVENIGGRPADYQLLYHWNFGPPILDRESQFVAPVDRLAPRNQRAADRMADWNQFDGPVPGFEERVFFMNHHSRSDGRTTVALVNRERSMGVAIEYNAIQLPCFSLWVDTGSIKDGYVAGLEPATNFPNPYSFEKQHGRIVTLEPGESHTFRTRMIPLRGDEIENTVKQIDTIQMGTSAHVADQPLAEWSCG